MIYFMRAGESGHVKIGWTKDHGTLFSRRAKLQTGQPYPLIVLRTIEDAPRWAEVWLHGFFSGVRATGEWFEFQAEMLTIEPPAERPTCGWTIILRLSEDELRDLDAFCADERRRTDDRVTRTETIRKAIAALIHRGTREP